jgi:aryl-alcohol dehydrogenase-like predicted oxidoreductase
MKRRDFLIKGTAGAISIGAAASSHAKEYQFKPELAPFSFKVDLPKPSGGTMPMREIGKTGIKVSQFCFGSHIRKDIVKYSDEREKIIREAYDLGINFFDVYDVEQECYQYEPMGRYLAPMINDVVISISFRPYGGRTPEQEIERDLKLFGRDHIDIARVLLGPDDPLWEKLFAWKEKGMLRAVGVMIHDIEQLDPIIGKIPVDYVLFPYNFYHNKGWIDERPDNFDPLAARLKEKGIGVLTMKPFAGDWLVAPFNKIAKEITKGKGPSLPQASLRYILNSGINPDAIFGGMYNLAHVYEDVAAFYNPTMSEEEKKLLEKLRGIADKSSHSWLPDHYKWLDKWAPGSRVEKVG